VCNLEVNEHLGDDADNTSSMQKSGFSHGPHEADVSAAIDKTDVLLGEQVTKLDSCIMISRVCPARRGAEDSNVSDHIVRISIQREWRVNHDAAFEAIYIPEAGRRLKGRIAVSVFADYLM
jgi:hypothetical protein